MPLPEHPWCNAPAQDCPTVSAAFHTCHPPGHSQARKHTFHFLINGSPCIFKAKSICFFSDDESNHFNRKINKLKVKIKSTWNTPSREKLLVTLQYTENIGKIFQHPSDQESNCTWLRNKSQPQQDVATLPHNSIFPGGWHHWFHPGSFGPASFTYFDLAQVRGNFIFGFERHQIGFSIDPGKSVREGYDETLLTLLFIEGKKRSCMHYDWLPTLMKTFRPQSLM